MWNNISSSSDPPFHSDTSHSLNGDRPNSRASFIHLLSPSLWQKLTLSSELIIQKLSLTSLLFSQCLLLYRKCIAMHQKMSQINKYFQWKTLNVFQLWFTSLFSLIFSFHIFRSARTSCTTFGWFVRSSVRPFFRSSVLPFFRTSVLPFFRSSVLSFFRSSVLPFFRPSRDFFARPNKTSIKESQIN